MPNEIDTRASQSQQSTAGSESTPALSRVEERQRHSLQSFFELSNELDYSLDLYESADRGLFNFMGHLGTSRSALWMLPSAGNDAPILLRSHGMPEFTAEAIGKRCVAKLLSLFRRDRKVIFVRDMKDVLDPGEMTLFQNSGLAILAALFTPGALLGVVALGKRLGVEEHQEYELEVLQASLDLLAVAIDNSGLYQRLQENNRALRQANEGLKELDRLKSEFMSNMHHELRTPLTVMYSYLEALLEELPKASQEYEQVSLVMKNARKLNKMVVNLLDYSGLTQNQLQASPVAADLHSILCAYHEERRTGVAAELREFRMTVEDGLPRAFCDERRVRQILDILVDNAVKFTPMGTRITMRVMKEAQGATVWFRIDIQDNGPGIPAEQLPKLFEPFLQLDGSRTRETGGLGLGLALARQLAEAMNGTLNVASEVGKGTAFTLRLRAV